MSTKGKWFEDCAIVLGSVFTTLIKANNKLHTNDKKKFYSLNPNNHVTREEYEYLLQQVGDLQNKYEILLKKIV